MDIDETDGSWKMHSRHYKQTMTALLRD